MRVSFDNKQRHAVWQKNYISFLLPFFIFATSVISLFALQAVPVSAATSNTLNFQGRLANNTGGLVPDGSYNIEFKIYDDAIAGSNLWTENRTGGNTVTVRNGYFSVYLGEVTPFGGSIPWDQDLWMTMNVNADGEMTPRFKLTAVPYAFRAGAVTDSTGNAYTGDDLIQKSPATIQTVNSVLAAIRLNQAGAGSLLQLQGNGTDVFTVDKSGNTFASGNLGVLGSSTTIGTATQAGSLVLNDGSANTTTIQAGSTTGNLSFTLPTNYGTSGDCLTGNGAGVLSFASTCGGTLSVNPVANVRKSVDETQNSTVNATATLQNDDELLFAIGANETWSFRFVVMANPNATPDMKMAVTAPAGATCKVGFNDQETAVAVGNTACGVSSGIMTGLTAEDTYEVFGTVVNGATPGNVTLQWAQNTANAANTIVRSGSFLHADRIAGTGQTAQAFIQSGNSFGALATLGTNDNNALSIMTNGTERLRILATGESQFGDDITANRVATGTTGTTTGTGTNSTTLSLLADSFNVNDVVFIDNVGQDYYTRITVDPGTGSYTVSPAVTYTNARTVTKYTVQNIGATSTDYLSQSNRFFQGYFLGGVVVGAGSTTISDGSIDSTTTLRLQSGGGNLEVGGGLTVTGVLSGDASGLTNITGASVDGSTITTLNASNISSGTLADGRLSANVALLNGGQTFSALTTFGAGLSVTGNTNATGDIAATGAISGATVSGDGSGLTNLSSANLSGALPAISGASLTTLNASNISSGTLADGRLTSNVTLLGNTFNGNSQLVQLTAGGALPALDGSGLTSLSAGNLTGAISAVDGSALTSLNATNIGSGTLADGRLSSNVALLAGIQTFTGAKTFGAGLTVSAGNLSVSAGNISASGAISGATVSGDGSGLTNLSSANLSGALPALSGASLTNLNGSNISTGTVADARLSTNVTLLGNTFNGNSQLVQLTAGGALPALNGSGLTNLSSANLSGALPAISGANLTGLNATNISSGTLADGRLTSNVTLLGNTFNGNNQLVQLSAVGALPSLNGSALTNLSSANLSGALPAISGASLTSLNATNISSGTLADGLLSSNVALLTGTQTFSGAKTFGSGLTISSGNLAGGSADITTTGQISGTTIVGGGSGITTLNATNLSSGTVADARLSSNVVLLTGTQTISGTKTFSGGFVLGLSTLSSSATLSRAVSLPDEAGAVCLSNSNNCGFLRIAAGSFQTDASINNVLAVDKTNATGNLIEMRRSGTAVFTVANSGALQIQSTSATALDIRNAGGTSYFSVDTSTGTVRVGPTAADGTGVLFVLDTKNTAGDPTGINGGSYYNSFTNRNRCFENGAWKDCIDQTSFTKAADQTVTNNAVFQNDTALVFAMAANSTYQVEATIPYVTTSAAADFKYTFTVPVGATITLYTDATTAVAATTICSIVASGQTCTLANTANLRGTITVHGVVTTAATAGNLQFQFAQNTATVGQSVTVFTGSSLGYRRP